MAVVGAETHQTLAGLSAGNIDVLEEAVGLRELNRAGSGLDARTFALVKVATLIALDAPPASYAWQIANAVEDGSHRGGLPRRAQGDRAAGRRTEGYRRRAGDHARDGAGDRRGRAGIAMPLFRRRRHCCARPPSEAGRTRSESTASAAGRGAGAGLRGRPAIGHAAAAPPPAPPARHDSPRMTRQRLGELGKLHEQGILTDDEFAKQKASILGL